MPGTPPEGWDEYIRLAQSVTELQYDDNQTLARIRYGDEPDDWGADEGPCHDCNVVKGQFHVPGCDVERCPRCGNQLISFECEFTSEGPFDWDWPPQFLTDH